MKYKQHLAEKGTVSRQLMALQTNKTYSKTKQILKKVKLEIISTLLRRIGIPPPTVPLAGLLV